MDASGSLNHRSGFTCITCRLVFANVELQKEHYTSEWHRYNAKRQVAGLPSISEEQFESKVKSFHEAESSAEKDRQSEKTYCKECRKVFQSKNAYDNHLSSKRHKQNVESFDPNAPVREPVQKKPERIDLAVQTLVEEILDYLCEEDSDDSGWETVSSESDEEEEDNGTIDLGYTLVLPSGAQIGHRELMRYYKQRLRPQEDVDKMRQSKAALKFQQSQQKALGWTGTTGSVAIRCARDFKFIKKAVKKNLLRRELHSNKLFKSRGRDDQQ